MRCGTFEPLALRNEIIAVHKKGAIINSQSVSMKFLHASTNKIAFVVRKKFGKAHERNLVKRRVREIMKDLQLQQKIHCVIFAKQDAFTIEYNQLMMETKKMFEKTQQAL